MRDMARGSRVRAANTHASVMREGTGPWASSGPGGTVVALKADIMTNPLKECAAPMG